MGGGVHMYIHIWASLAAQMVKNLPAMQETWVQCLGWEDPLEKEMCDPIDGSPPGFPVPGFLQARTLEWSAFPFSEGSSRPADQTWVSLIVGRLFTI